MPLLVVLLRLLVIKTTLVQVAPPPEGHLSLIGPAAFPHPARGICPKYKPWSPLVSIHVLEEKEEEIRFHCLKE